jgi:hypothetical protein
VASDATAVGGPGLQKDRLNLFFESVIIGVVRLRVRSITEKKKTNKAQ